MTKATIKAALDIKRAELNRNALDYVEVAIAEGKLVFGYGLEGYVGTLWDIDDAATLIVNGDMAIDELAETLAGEI
jgi:hypothetical protein